ncbi:putative receptor-like serine/threonine-protein kinase [Artemisia annua]|uniref:Putative receptor-like serine/threonine-protein kinase n=1 Tax=Artemisia annua TaxID=35608 RepID=A0A2U1N2C9_ARTAN|nr:putative receptor-like serine/threonine-protein kinase [Artemisia annua]
MTLMLKSEVIYGKTRKLCFARTCQPCKVFSEKSSVEPLRYALRQVVKAEDHVIVLVIYNMRDLPDSPVITSCCIGTDGRNHHEPSDRERYIKIVREEISQETEGYMRIFRPFYKECKNNRVRFTVKIVVGSTIEAIIMEEKNNTGATGVIIGRSFARENGSWVPPKHCSLSLHGDDEEVLWYTCNHHQRDDPESSRTQTEFYSTQRMSRLKKKSLSRDEQKLIYCTLPNFEGIYQPYSSSSSSIESTNESSRETEVFESLKETRVTTSLSHEHGIFVELSWEVISDITDRFMNIIPFDSNDAFQMYGAYLEDRSCAVFIKRYIGTEYRYVLEAEKRAALTMYHKNIVGLLGFHQNENAMALVFPFSSRGALLDRFLNGSWTKELKIPFPSKMNIVIGVAQGLRYMHEQCPRGPIVHGDLRPCNIILGHNLQPQITSFGQAKWLQIDQSSPAPRNSCGHKHPSDPNSLELIKSDILAFGILLLRLFSIRSAPRDDKSFLTWARPLLAQRAYHILYDESEYDDVHGLLVVTSVAARCISTRSKSRPCMSKVLSFLKGEVCCAEQTFPSTESSPNIASPDSNLWKL